MNAHLPEESSLFAARTAQSWREQDASLREHEQADLATRAARNAIKAIPNISEREFCALIAALNLAMTKCGFAHMKYAEEAMEYLTSAHAVLEQAAEHHGE